MPNASIDADCSKNVHFWGLNDKKFHGGVKFLIPAKFQNSIVSFIGDILLISSKKSTDEQELHLKQHGPQPDKL
jgi:hypothetical protein